ncbi:GntR family transcriptional regulator [Pueribacillus theae]|uniref:GntR family transcriptional regulator n=1 Tax=Pueribacillus theae TaxID=2171751 RepID=A0A2U1K780_9BACI|nr:FadR/GntR family transcriptional regulator [Pueribacillus theae]PWA13074.1 GntR family transcriptional regulator [Pueribacillus theae]
MFEVEQVQSRKMYEDVVEQLKKNILEGNLKPGDKLPSVRALSTSFRVGQSTIREALSVLKTIGLIETRQGEGTFIRHYDSTILNQSISDTLFVTKEEIIDLLDVRKTLERGTVSLAAERRTADDLRKIESIINEMEKELTSDHFGEEADWAFHFAIAEASRNRIMISLMEELSIKVKQALKASRFRMYATPGMPEKLLQEHRGIFEAIREQNGTLAEERMLAHLIGVQKQIITIDEDKHENGV